MADDWKAIARATHAGSESGAVTFPQSVQMLMGGGFDGYMVDLRRSTRTYYLPSGEAVEFSSPPTAKPVGAKFEAETIRQAIKEAQELKPGYTYQGFCDKIAAAGCAGYLVALLGKRVVYFGRTGETHTESFPGTQPPAGQNEAVVRQFFQLLNAEDLEGLRALLAEDAAWLPQARDMPGAGEYRGRNVVVDDFLKPIRGLFARGSPSNRILSMVSNDALVLVETHGTGKLADGRPYDNRYAWAFEIRDGKVAVIREYLDSYYIIRLFGKP